MKCMYCGDEVPEDATQCPNCSKWLGDGATEGARLGKAEGKPEETVPSLDGCYTPWRGLTESEAAAVRVWGRRKWVWLCVSALFVTALMMAVFPAFAGDGALLGVAMLAAIGYVCYAIARIVGVMRAYDRITPGHQVYAMAGVLSQNAEGDVTLAGTPAVFVNRGLKKEAEFERRIVAEVLLEERLLIIGLNPPECDLTKRVEAARLAELKQTALDLDEGEEIECPACQCRFVIGSGHTECPECGLVLDAYPRDDG